MILDTVNNVAVPTALLLPLVLGPLTSYLMDLVKKASTWVALQTARTKQLIVAGLSILSYGAAVGVQYLTQTHLDVTWWGSLAVVALTAGMAFATKNLRQAAT